MVTIILVFTDAVKKRSENNVQRWYNEAAAEVYYKEIIGRKQNVWPEDRMSEVA